MKTILIYSFVIVSSTYFAGCAGSDDAASSKPMRTYEENFDPSKYRDTVVDKTSESVPSANTLPDTEQQEEFLTIERVEQTMGFRVQIFSTTSFEDAEMRRDEYVETLGDTVAVNIVFDAPYYKVRVGNYLEKAKAEAECSRLKEMGLKEAWVVRDRVNYSVFEKVLKR